MAFRTCVLLAVTALAVGACGSSPLPPHHPVVHASSVPPVPCSQQYTSWRSGQAKGAARNLAAKLRAAQNAPRAQDAASLESALKRLSPAALALASEPMPRCADPGAIYAGFVLRIYQAGHDAGAARGLSGLLRAAAQLDGARKIERQLTAEVSRSLGTSNCRPASTAINPRTLWPPC
jgi:hypothetical protein